MRKELLRLTALLVLSVCSYGMLTPQITQAQCGCSCTYVCPHTCNLSCDGCDYEGLIAAAYRCCHEERNRTPCVEESDFS